MGFYRFRHIERGMGMIFKSVGLPPRGRLSDFSAKAAWRLMQWRRRRLAAQLDRVDEYRHGRDSKREQYQGA
jgi:hypothetical protein